MTTEVSGRQPSLLRLLARRWYLVFAGVALTLLAIAHTTSGPIVYSTKVDLVLLPPLTWSDGNSLQSDSESVIYFATMVQTIVSQGTPSLQLVSPDATLYGAGVTDGSLVRMIDTGGQWTTSIAKPVITVEVVKPSRGAALDAATALVARVEAVTNELQSSAKADPNDWIKVQRPASIDVQGIGGSRRRAIVGILVLGAGITIWVTKVTDQLVRRRVHSPRRVHRPKPA